MTDHIATIRETLTDAEISADVNGRPALRKKLVAALTSLAALETELTTLRIELEGCRRAAGIVDGYANDWCAKAATLATENDKLRANALDLRDLPVGAAWRVFSIEDGNIMAEVGWGRHDAGWDNLADAIADTPAAALQAAIERVTK